MKIDLKEYGDELEYWVEAFKPFVDHASWHSLKGICDTLADGRDNRRTVFQWFVRDLIWTKIADRYDGVDKTPHEIRVGWRFQSTFVLGTDPRRKPIWTVKEMVTQIHVCLAENNGEILRFHYDMKNEGQLGPHVHMQFSEEYMKDNKRIPIAVPRFPSPTMLPTDCLDLVLSEFFPFEWPRSQSDSRGLKILQTRQRARMVMMAQAMINGWAASPRRTPISAMQSSYMPELQIA